MSLPMKLCKGNVRRPSRALSVVSLVAGALALLATGCNFRGYVLDRAVAEQVRFVPDTEHFAGWDLRKVTDRVYTFRWTWDRSIVVLTDEGVVVTDPMNGAPSIPSPP